MIWFIIHIKPFYSFSARTSLVIDEGIVLVFLLFGCVWLGELDDDEESMMKQGYALCSLLVLVIAKNLAKLIY